MWRSVKAFTVSVVLTGVMMGIAPVTHASAAEDDCDPGEFCLWGEDNYQGCFWGEGGDWWWLPGARWEGACWRWSPNQGANSMKNRGAFCNVKIWDWPQHAGGWRIVNRPAIGGWTKDPDLWNNWWWESPQPERIENDISAFDWIC